MRHHEALKTKYRKMPNAEKVAVGTALVKVNSGVGLPEDLKLAAEFLKGSDFPFKPGALEELIHYLHQDPPDKKKSRADKTGTKSISRKTHLSDGMINGLQEYPEDLELTVREKTKNI